MTNDSLPGAGAEAVPAGGAMDDPAAMWDNRYRAPAYIFGTEPNVWLRLHAGLWQRGQRVLCVADGEGRNSVWLAQQDLQVEAFDISPVGVAKARQLARDSGAGVAFHVSDCDRWPWQESSCDGVAAIFVQFADPSMRARLFANMIRCLRPGGILILQGYTPRQLAYRTGGPPLESHLYTERMLREAFAGMTILDLREYEEELEEGFQHRGRSALIGLAARKPLS